MDFDERPMQIDHDRLDPLRRGRGPIPEHVIDEFLGGRLSRRDFLRRGTAVGLSLPLLGAILEACGSSSTTTTTTAAAKGKAGATIKAGIEVPAAYVSPITVEDTGGLETLDQVGEFLAFTDQQLNFHPWLATSWSPNADGTVWTFKIRQGVKFNDGTPMTVDDVVYSYQSLSNPKSGGNALSQFGGVLEPDGVVKKDDTTIEFHLLAPNGGFIDACSNDNYNMIIVPKGTDFSKFEKTMPGTGRFKMTSFSPNIGATFVRNPYYWGTPALPAKLEFVFYSSEAAETSALEAGDIDCNDGFSMAISPQLNNSSLYNVNATKSALHRELSMRCDNPSFANKYVRQALAYTLDRPAIVSALFKGYASIGNDSPFAPIYKQTVGPPAVPQRAQNLTLAKQLLAKAGMSRGFKTPLYSETTQEMPDYCQIIKASAAKIGIDITLDISTPDAYYGNGVFGSSNWLDGEMSLVDYGGRSIPNLLLEAPLQSINSKTGQGAWNAAHFDNPTYDSLSKQYVAAVDLSSQRMLAQQIEKLLLDETPIIYGYFYDVLWATQKNVHGIYLEELSLFFWNATKS
jgi:peptide/nickel transport system substrate-binding protein